MKHIMHKVHRKDLLRAYRGESAASCDVCPDLDLLTKGKYGPTVVERNTVRYLPHSVSHELGRLEETEKTNEALREALEQAKKYEKSRNEKRKVEAELKKARAELEKPHIKYDDDGFREKVFEFIRGKIQDCGQTAAIRLALREDWVVEGAKDRKMFGANREKDPTFGGLEAQYDYHKNDPKQKPTQQRPRPKRQSCDFADGGVKVVLPSERYKE